VTKGSRGRRPTAIVLGVLIAVIVVALGSLVLANAGSEGRQGGTRKQSPIAKNAPTAVAASTTTGAPIAYQVERGDTLTAIATRFGVSAAAIVAVNQIADQDHLTEGQSLLIPPPPPVRLVITPAKTTPGGSVRLELMGAKPSEIVIFEIDSPNQKFNGPPHTASGDGTVRATYEPAFGDPVGTYSVIAKGNQATTAQGSFRVDAAGS
jgi:LysM repeat protein